MYIVYIYSIYTSFNNNLYNLFLQDDFYIVFILKRKLKRFNAIKSKYINSFCKQKQDFGLNMPT